MANKRLRSNIEEVRYRNAPGYRLLSVRGWAFHTDNSPLVLQVYVNGRQHEFERIHTVRQDVLDSYKDILDNPRIGLQVNIRPDEDVRMLELKTDTGEVILNMNEKQLEKCSEYSLLQAYCDSFQPLGVQGECIAVGWALSADGKQVDFEVLDPEGKSIPFDCRRIQRGDLVELNLVDKAHSKAGYYLTFFGDVNRRYTLRLTNGTDVLDFPLSDQHENGFGLVRAYWKAANPVRIRNAIHYFQKNGFTRFMKRLKKGPYQKPKSYQQWFDRQAVTVSELRKQEQHVFEFAPKISIIVATYNTPEDYLKEMINTVIKQSYGNWELCIGDGSDNDKVERYIQSHYASEPRIKFKKLDQNYGISGNMNGALSLATGEYVSLYDHDDLLTPDCLYEIVSSMQEIHHDVVYTDEDKLNDVTKELNDPHFKPDFALDQLRSHNYITHFLTVKKDLVDQVGGLHSEYDGSQDYDFILRVSELAQSIHHIPKVLYHWRMHPSSTAMNPESKMYCYTAGQKAIEDHLKRCGVNAEVEMMRAPFYGMYRVRYSTDSNPLVSIIIPNKDHIELLEQCLDSIDKKSDYTNLEIIIVENNSVKPETFAGYERLKNKYPRLEVLKWTEEFNYSSINNFGARHAKGELLLFLNNDTELIEPGSIREMAGLALQKDIGAVGAKLLFADDTVQHAGVVLGFRGYAAHAFTGIDRDNVGHMVRPLIVSDYSAVTAACMMVKKSDFELVGGFDPIFRVAANDVDFCLKLLKLGKRNVMTPFSLWYHYESKTRQSDKTGSNRERFEYEVQLFQKKWPDESRGPDPFHNTNFNLDIAPFYLDM